MLRSPVVGRIAALALAAAVAFAPPASPAAVPFEGRWRLSLDRPGWEPREAIGTLVLERGKGGWKGTLAFEILMNGQRQDLVDLRIEGETIAFKLAALGYAMKGEKAGGSISGVCDTTRGQQFTWTATPDRPVPVDLFEKGLSFKGYFPRGEARDLGIDAASLQDLVREAESSDTDALLVLKDGKVVCERTFGREAGPIPVMSVTKFVTAFAVALLLQEGRIESLDAPVSTWFPAWKEGARGMVTLRHLATHTSGIAHGKTADALNKAEDRVAFVLAAEVADPGKTWSYNNEAVALLSGIVSKAAGKPCDAYLGEKLLKPLGIEDWKWDRDGAGNTVTYAQLRLTARDLARIGQFVVDGGKAGKRGILSAGSLALLEGEATPVEKGQGLLWLRILEGTECVGVRHDGWLGQHVVVYPRSGLVGVRLRRGAKGEGKEWDFGRFPARLRACLRR